MRLPPRALWGGMASCAPIGNRRIRAFGPSASRLRQQTCATLRGVPRGYRIQKKLSRLAVRYAFHVATALSIAPIYNNPSVQSAHPVRLLRTVCLLQGTERPIGVRNHPDTAALC